MKTLFSLAAVASAAAALGGTTYSVALIGDFNSATNYTNVYGLNDHGEVAGYVENPTNHSSQGIRWAGGGLLQVLPGINGSNSGGAGINNSGNIVGVSVVAPNSGNVATLWSPDNAPHSLGIPNGGSESYVSAINNRDEAVGQFRDSNSQRLACILTYGFARESLGTLPGDVFSYATSINDHGMVVGSSNNGGVSRAFAWTRGEGMVALPKFFGSNYSTGEDVNNSGMILGNFSASGIFNQPFLYNSTAGLITMGSMGQDNYTNGIAINDDGMVVGQSANVAGIQRAFAWTAEGGYIDLNTELDASGQNWNINKAVNVNSSGQILAYGYYDHGQGHYSSGSILLTPHASPVPEPASICALGLGAMALLRRRKKG